MQGKLFKTNGEIIDIKINKSNEVGEIHYPTIFPKVKYSVNEKTYEIWSDYAGGQTYELGQKIEIYYNIENPHEIQIKPFQQKAFYLFFIILGILITSFTCLFTFII